MSDDAGFAAVPRWMLKDERFTGQMIATYTALQSFANAGGAAFPAVSTLAKRARLAVSTTRAAIRALEALGVVETRPGKPRADGGQTSNTYIGLTHDPGQTPPPVDGAPPTAPRRPPHRGAAREVDPEELDPDEQEQQPRGRATEKQIEFLMDIHVACGGSRSPEVEETFRGYTMTQADAEIRAGRHHVRRRV